MIGASVLGFLLLAAPAAEPPAHLSPDPSAIELRQIAVELRGLRESTERLTALLEKLLENQHLDFLLKRMELKQAGILPIEAGIRRARDDQTAYEGERVHLQEQWDRVDQEIRDQVDAGTDLPGSDHRIQKRNLGDEIDRIDGTLEGLERRLWDLEDELDRRRKELVQLEESLQEYLNRGRHP